MVLQGKGIKEEENYKKEQHCEDTHTECEDFLFHLFHADAKESRKKETVQTRVLEKLASCTQKPQPIHA